MSLVVVTVSVAAGAMVNFCRPQLAAYTVAAIVVWVSWIVFHPGSIGTTIGLVEVDVLIYWSFVLYQADCPLSLVFAGMTVLIPGLL